MRLISDPKAEAVFANYPRKIQPQMHHLRALVLSASKAMDGLDQLEAQMGRTQLSHQTWEHP